MTFSALAGVCMQVFGNQGIKRLAVCTGSITAVVIFRFIGIAFTVVLALTGEVPVHHGCCIGMVRV